jgi:hypothetical protein
MARLTNRLNAASVSGGQHWFGIARHTAVLLSNELDEVPYILLNA